MVSDKLDGKATETASFKMSELRVTSSLQTRTL